MKTVQEWLNEVDEDKLAGTFFAEFPVDFLMIPNRELTLGEIQDRTREHFLHYVHRMKSVAIPEDSGDHVFFACKEYREGHSEISANTCSLKELRSKDSPDIYTWMLTGHAKVMGYLVADTEFTKKNIYKVLSHILHETSFFGYTQEELEIERRKLEESLKVAEAESDKAVSVDDLWEEFGWEKPIPDPEAEEKEDAIHAAEYEYTIFCRNREIAKLKQSVLAMDREHDSQL